MRLFVRCVLLSLIALPALAEDGKKPAPPTADWVLQRARMYDLEYRADMLRPRRLDSPLRELNISDNEVREIQDVAGKYALNSMLNISPVIAGCPCEEGPLCTDQVYVVATTPEKTVGLQLSRIRNSWTVGLVQKWWLRYDEFKTRAPSMDYRAFFDAKNQLLLEFPVCALKDASKDGATTAQSRDTKK